MKSNNNSEKQWQAEYDADTMARYEEIMSDASRKKAAIAAAKSKAADLNKRASAMNKVAGTSSKSSTTKSKKK